jgi:hypothetical protein
MPDCWLEVSLRPAISNKGFLDPRASAELALNSTHAALSIVTSTFAA